MSQLQTQRTASFNTQQTIRFSQHIREKELSGDLIPFDDLFEIFQKYDKKKPLQLDGFFREIEKNAENGEYTEDESDYDCNSLDYLGALCYKYLPKITLDDFLTKNILCYVTIFLEKNRPQSYLNTSNYDALMADYFSCIDSICNYITKNIQQGTNKFDYYSDFFLVIVKLIWIYLKPYKQQDLECVESQYNPTTVINSILTTIGNLIEKNLTNLTDAKNELSIFRLCNTFLYLIDYFKENSKSVIQLWKVIRKIIVLNGLLKSPRLCEKNKGIFLKNIIPILCNRIHEQIENLKICFASLVSQQQATQNQTAPDTNRTILLGSFLFKIFKTLFETYFKDLHANLYGQFFRLTMNLCSLINSVILSEHAVSVDVYLRDDVSPSQTQMKTTSILKEYQDAKMRFFKEMPTMYEDLLKLFENVDGRNDFFHYFKSNPIDLESLNENSEKLLLFYCVLINRSKCCSLNETMFLNDILNLLESCSLSMHLPSYVLKYDDFLTDFNFGLLSKLNYAKRQDVQAEFYDFVHFCLCRFLLNLKKNPSVFSEHIYFLANNMLEVKSGCKYRSKISCDLLLSIGVLDKSVEYLIFLCQIYELVDLSANNCFKILLIDLFETYHITNSALSKSLETHLTQLKLPKSYSLLCKYVDIESEANKAFRLNVLDKNLNLFTSLIELIKNLSKSNTSEQIWIKKIVTFIQTNNPRNELLDMQTNILNESKWSEENAYESLQDKLVQFIQLVELDNLLKYFEAARVSEEEDGTISTQTRQRIGSSLDNLKIIFSFISYSIEMFKLLFVRKRSGQNSNESKLTFMLRFLSKYCSIDLKEHLDINKSLNLVLTNIKCQTVHLMRVILAETDVKDQQLQTIFYELFFKLLNDSNLSVKFFTLECFNEVPTSSQTGIRLMRDFAQGKYDAKEFFLCFNNKTPFDSSLTDYIILLNRSNDHMKTLREHYKKSDVNIMMSQLNTQSDVNLDDTMNALMTTMNTTIDEDKMDEEIENIIESESFKHDAEISLRQIEENLGKLQDLYNNVKNDNLKKWLKQKMSEINDKVIVYL